VPTYQNEVYSFACILQVSNEGTSILKQHSFPQEVGKGRKARQEIIFHHLVTEILKRKKIILNWIDY